MKVRSALLLAACFFLAIETSTLFGQALNPEPDQNPTGNTGALKTQIETGGSYDAHSGNGTRIVPDLHVPGALGVYGLDFVRYWNSLPIAYDNPDAADPSAFGVSAWTHSWGWSAVYGEQGPEPIPGSNEENNTYTTSITITFPDGHVNKYKIARFGPTQFGPGDPRFGPPYSSGEIGLWTTPPGAGVHDTVGDMASDGHEFWLFLADGGSVHFVGESPPDMSQGYAYWSYLATEVFDPHGLRTDLSYNSNGHLTRVEQEGGRWLTITWGTPIAWLSEMITQVSSGGAAGSQSVTYTYSAGPVLSAVTYPDDPAPGQSATATYTYGSDPDTSDGRYTCGLRLVTADDPRFPGPMRTIRYSYLNSHCPRPLQPPNPIPTGYYDRFYALSNSITAEQSGDHVDAQNQPINVSRFALHCLDGTRTEWNGFGAWRMFYFGSAAAVGSGSHGYETGRLTDYTLTSVNDVPNERQSYLNGHPYRTWDGRGIETLSLHEDGSGLPTEVRHTGSDGSFHTYDRVNPGNSAAPDPLRIRNPYHHWLFSQTDERHLTTYYRRDSRRRITRIDYPDGSGEEYTYNDFNQVLTHTLPSGAVETFEYDGAYRLVREYNSVDRALHGVNADKDYTYDALERVATVKDGRARINGKDFSTKMTYNGRHKILKVEYAGMLNAPDNPKIQYGYDAYGNCTSITDELGHISTYEYDSYRRCISYTEPLNATGLDGTPNAVPSRRWDWIYDRYIGGVGWFDAATHTSKNWRIQVEPAFNSAGERRMTNRWHDLEGRITMEQTGWIQRPGNLGDWYFSGDGETHWFSYDENGNKKTYTDPVGRLTTYDYDPRNRLWKTNETVNTIPRTTETLYDPTGNKTLVRFPDTRTEQWLDYDAFGQPGRFLDERGNTTNLAYWWGPMKKLGMVTTHRDKDGGGTEDQATVFSYDYMGRPTHVWFPDGSYPNGSHEDSTYEFGQLKTWRSRKGQMKTIQYDARGRETSHSWDDGVTPAVARSWDAASRLTGISNIFSTIDYAYDDASQVQWEGNTITGAGGRVQTTYRRYGDGNVAYVQYPDGLWVNRQYTARGQLRDVWDSFVGWQRAVGYNYLPDGKVNYQDYGNDTRTDFQYDGRGMTSVISLHRLSQYQNYSWRQYWRDERDRITAFQKSTNNSYNPMENGRGDRFRYDEEGQLLEAWYNAANPSVSGDGYWRYDGLGTYDALGNRAGWEYVSSRGWMNFGRRDNGLNQYSSWENEYPEWPQHWGSPILYDDNFGSPYVPPGNGVTMADGWVTASYNALNQPVAIWSIAYQGTPNVMYFGYDPLGRCVKRWLAHSDGSGANSATYFYYDGSSLIEEEPGVGSTARNYIHGARVDEIVKQLIQYNPAPRFFHYDARGHCALQTDASGNIVEQYEYDAFGYPYFFNASGSELGYSPWGNRFLFTGREWLSDLKLYDFRNRLYQPELGRFLQPDPKEFAAGDYNLYRYCHNDPVNKNDPTGLQEFFFWGEVPPIARPQIPPELLEEAGKLAEPKNSLPMPNGGRLDVKGDPHHDAKLGRDIETPHVHEPKAPLKPPYDQKFPNRGLERTPRDATPKDLQDAIKHVQDALKKLRDFLFKEPEKKNPLT